MAFSVAQVLPRKDVALAHRLAPYDGRITAALAASLMQPDVKPAERQHAEELARQAVLQDAMAVEAIWTLGINAQIHGNVAAARQWFRYSQKLSRRDVNTQLWTIEDAVARDDIAEVLRHYDITLRTQPRRSVLLYPVLAEASSDPVIRRHLVRTLAAKPAWSESFIDFVAGGKADPLTTAALFEDLQRAGVVVPAGARARTTNLLITSGHIEAAWQNYAALRAGVSREQSRDPAFAGTGSDSRFDWTSLGEGSIATSIGAGAFQFSVPSGVGGPLLQQFQLLPPGKYRLAGHSVAIDQVESALPYWLLACQSGAELGRIDVPNSARANGRFEGTFSVPQGCPVQTLTLVARPSDAVTGLSGQIDRVQLAPLP